VPELPEVETIVRALRLGGRGAASIIGETISSAEVLWARTLATLTDPMTLTPRLAGQTIETVDRRGKYLILQLSNDALLFHLRMSGDLRVEAADRPFAPHDRFYLGFQSGRRLAFNDARKFGRVWLVRDPAEVLAGLGTEPFDPQLTPALFYDRLHGRSRQLKPLLLDQSFLAGLGNIYTDEALHAARLHPLRLASSLSLEDATALLDSIRETLLAGIHRQGSSIDWVYRGGEFQNYFHVYQRTGEACPRCGTMIQRIVVGQRGTHFCPNCQTE
jgi:formamidopyrimidine-DNA glycosylase